MQIKPWQVLNSKVVYETPWIQVIEELCETQGTQLTYTKVKRRDEGSQIIPVEPDGRIWFVQQYRPPLRKVIWQLPAEGKKIDESFEAAALRGIEEEIHKRAGKIVDLGAFHPDPGLLDQTSHFFVATELEEVGEVEKHHDSEEEVEELNTGLFTWTEIDQMISRGEICDNWTLAGLYMYQRHLNTPST